MRSALTLTAALAWIMIQVPLVFCDSACGASVNSVLVMESHACHDVSSTRHQVRCGHTSCTHDHGQPEQPAPKDSEGEHVVVLVQSHVHGGPVLLPAHALHSVALLVRTAEGSDASPELGLVGAWGELALPQVADPVSAADRLQV
jgi:hypothetical protein